MGFTNKSELYIEETRSLLWLYRTCNNHGMPVKHIPSFSQYYFTNYFDLSYVTDGKYYWLNDDILELAALGQHYGLITRLLDWSQDRRVAFYFAYDSGKKENKDIAIWAINAQYIQRIKERQQNNIEEICNGEILIKNIWKNINYNELFNVMDNSLPLIFCVPDYSWNPNLCAQNGVLSMWQYNILNSKEMEDRAKDKGEKAPFDFHFAATDQINEYMNKEVDVRPLDEKLDDYINGLNESQQENIIKAIMGDEAGQDQINTSSTEEVFKGLLIKEPLLYKFIIPKKLLKEIEKRLKMNGYTKAKLMPGFEAIVDEVMEEMKWDK